VITVMWSLYHKHKSKVKISSLFCCEGSLWQHMPYLYVSTTMYGKNKATLRFSPRQNMELNILLCKGKETVCNSVINISNYRLCHRYAIEQILYSIISWCPSHVAPSPTVLPNKLQPILHII
jgi:hypothetical protein